MSMPYIWVMGLSVDEELHWAAVKIPAPKRLASVKILASEEGVPWPEENNQYVRGSEICERLCALPDTKEPTDLQEVIRDKLKVVKQKHPSIFREAKAIGVSTVGIVDIKNCKLLNIDRKNWAYHGDKQKHLVDFQAIFHKICDSLAVKVSVQNDAIAKCIAEYKQQYVNTSTEPVGSLCYAMFHNGVNGGVVRGSTVASGPVLFLKHHEIGHVFPARHPADKKFKSKYSGCKVHNECFVALGSGERINRQWLAPLQSLKDSLDRPHPWEIIAYYVAQFCWTVFLTIPTDRILLGGSVIFEELLQPVRDAFDKLNTYKNQRYIDAPVLDEKFISMALLSTEEASVIGSLELARIAYAGGRDV